MHDDRAIPPTERRLMRARQRGTAPVRRMLIALCATIGAIVGAAIADLPGALTQMLRESLAAEPVAAAPATDSMFYVVATLLRCVWPVFAGCVVGALLGTLAQTGGLLVWRRPTASVVARVAAMSGPGAWGRAGAGLTTAVVATGAGALALCAQWSRISALPRAPLDQSFSAGIQIALTAGAAALAALALMAAVDAVLARHRWHARLWMNANEAREEQRASDGDPHLRSRRQRAARRSVNALVSRGTPARESTA